MTLVWCPYSPVRISAREGQHTGVSTYPLVNSAPWATICEYTAGMRVGLNVDQAWSSDRMIRTLGRASGGLARTAGEGRTAKKAASATRSRLIAEAPRP